MKEGDEQQIFCRMGDWGDWGVLALEIVLEGW